MADWILKGSLKGPQGDPGQDAQLPTGGTEGQVLTKTSGGEAWADVPEPDLTDVVKYNGATFSTSDYDFIDTVVVMVNDTMDQIHLQASNSGSSILIGSETSAEISVQDVDANHEVLFGATPSSALFSIDSKQITSITDAIADSPAGKALVTDKAVADYVDAHGMPSVVPISKGGTGATTADGAAMMVFAHAPEASPTQAGVVKTLSDEDFCAYMGMEYDPADWS